MSELTTKRRNILPPGKFGIFDKRSGEGKYPMPDASHAENAKARATQQFEKGNLSAEQRAKINAKANVVLKK